MKFSKILQELDSEEKVRMWSWLAKFDGKRFVCPKCNHEEYYQHKKNPEIRECKVGHFYTRLRARTIFQNMGMQLTGMPARCSIQLCIPILKPTVNL